MSKFSGISGETRSQQKVNFDIAKLFNDYKEGRAESPFPTAILKSVEVGEIVNKKFTLLEGVELEKDEKPTVDQVTPDSIRYTLNFNWESPDGVYSHKETIYDIEDNDTKYQTKERMINERIAHFFDAFAGQGKAAQFLPLSEVFKDVKKEDWNFKTYFSGIARIFNTCKNENPVYLNKSLEPILVRIKLTRNTYNSRNPNAVTMPLGNVVERILPNIPSILQVTSSDKFNIIEVKEKGFAGSSPAFGNPSEASTTFEDDL